MALLIDTSVAIAMERERESLQSLLDRASDEQVAVAAITASELLHGVHRADTAMGRERRLRHVETLLEAVSVLSFNLDVARVHSRIRADLVARGNVIGAHDLQIAATALNHDLPLATLDREHFSRVDGLRLVEW